MIAADPETNPSLVVPGRRSAVRGLSARAEAPRSNPLARGENRTMAYRRNSFDPGYHEDRPELRLRPFDRWQWVGVAVAALAAVVAILFFLQSLHLVRLPFTLGAATLAVLALSGNSLLLRDPELAPGTLDSRRMWSLVGVALGLVILAVDVMA